MNIDPDREAKSSQELLEVVKEYLAEPRHRIKLDDLAIDNLKRFSAATAVDQFPLKSPDPAGETVIARLDRYESAVHDLQTITVLLSHWGTADNFSTLCRIAPHVCGKDIDGSGFAIWSAMQWYPAIRLTYAGGISAIASENYQALASLMLSSTYSPQPGEEVEAAVLRVGRGAGEIDGANVFKQIPDFARSYASRSEYLFQSLRPDIRDLLFVGQRYEALFDRFEVLLALVHADLLEQKSGRTWGPFGRFAWKYKSRTSNPFTRLLQEAECQKDDWLPVRAGFFGGSHTRFMEVASAYKKLLDSLGWY